MFSDFISINEGFRSSINLDFDLNDEAKIRGYIPTQDICDVLKTYFDSFLGKENDRSTVLVGPYGKGKSYLLLVLCYLISAVPDTETYQLLLQRISSIDNRLVEKIRKFNKTKQRLLPVLINSNYDNLVQAFQLGMKDSLERYGLTQITPQTTYDVCLRLFEEWEQDADFNNRVLKKCLEMYGISKAILIRQLKNCSPDALSKFKDLYLCVTKGLAFNPLINDDIAKMYSGIAHELPNYGFSGLFVIFDEFSKFLDSRKGPLGLDLKIIQDFAELATRSAQAEQISLCCVTHKSLSHYEKKKDSANVDLFRTVEGRFKEIRFNRSLEDNYQIIASAITIEDPSYAAEYIRRNQSFYQSVSEKLDLSTSESTSLFNGCFPLNPMAVYALVALSEMVAQNERTLFTFLSDTDEESFNSFIHKKDTGLLNLDCIYDYFSDILKKDDSEFVRSVWYRCEGILSKIVDASEKSLIKALAILLIVGDGSKLQPDSHCLSLVCHFDFDKTSAVVSALISKHLLKRNPITNLISFATSNSKDIDDQIAVLKNTKLKSADVASICNAVSPVRYYLPRRYNEQNKITRFYRVRFITENQLLLLNSLEILKNESFCDGLVLCVLRAKKSMDELSSKFLSFQNAEVLARIPSKPLDSFFEDKIIEFAALQELRKQCSEEDLLSKELDLLLEELEEDLKAMFNAAFFSDAIFLPQNGKHYASFEDALSGIMEEAYPKQLVFNNELANKNNVSSQYQKSINHVIDWLLSGSEEFPYSETSPESTVFKSVVETVLPNTCQRSIVDSFKTSLVAAGDDAVAVSTLISTYGKKPYGIRKGIIPILLALALSELLAQDNVVLYFKEREIELDATNLVKATVADEGYSLSVSKGSKSQLAYVKNTLISFGAVPTDNLRKDIPLLATEIRKFFVGLPPLIRVSNHAFNPLGIDESILTYKEGFMAYNLNPFDLILKKPLKVFGTTSYKKVTQALVTFREQYPSLLIGYKEKQAALIKTRFHAKGDASLKSLLNDSIDRYLPKGQTPILSETEKRLYELIRSSITYSDYEAINDISRLLLGIQIDDWREERSEELATKLERFFQALSSASSVSSDVLDSLLEGAEGDEETAMGKMMRNNLESILEEYGGSVSTSEKVSILKALLKELL